VRDSNINSYPSPLVSKTVGVKCESTKNSHPTLKLGKRNFKSNFYQECSKRGWYSFASFVKDKRKTTIISPYPLFCSFAFPLIPFYIKRIPDRKERRTQTNLLSPYTVNGGSHHPSPYGKLTIICAIREFYNTNNHLHEEINLRK